MYGRHAVLASLALLASFLQTPLLAQSGEPAVGSSRGVTFRLPGVAAFLALTIPPSQVGAQCEVTPPLSDHPVGVVTFQFRMRPPLAPRRARRTNAQDSARSWLGATSIVREPTLAMPRGVSHRARDAEDVVFGIVGGAVMGALLGQVAMESCNFFTRSDSCFIAVPISVLTMSLLGALRAEMPYFGDAY